MASPWETVGTEEKRVKGKTVCKVEETEPGKTTEKIVWPTGGELVKIC